MKLERNVHYRIKELDLTGFFCYTVENGHYAVFQVRSSPNEYYREVKVELGRYAVEKL